MEAGLVIIYVDCTTIIVCEVAVYKVCCTASVIITNINCRASSVVLKATVLHLMRTIIPFLIRIIWI